MGDDLPGERVRAFRLVRALGSGGMGTVYLGVNEDIGSKVAIKVLHRHLANDAEAVARFRGEARATNRIASDHVVKIIDLDFTPPDRHAFVMELLEGRALNELTLPVGPTLLVHIITQLCDALTVAHGCGVVHRDLKPQNVRLVTHGNERAFVKVLDFGIARVMHDASSFKTHTGQVLGTPAYMAPEQTRGEFVDARADIYSLGVLAFELATGRLPFSGSVETLLRAHQDQPPPAAHLINPSLPRPLSEAIMRALEKAPEARWQSAAEVRAAFAGPSTHSLYAPPPAMKARVFDSHGSARWLTLLTLSASGAQVEGEAGPRLHSVVTLELERDAVAIRLVGRVTTQLETGFVVAFDTLTDAQRMMVEAVAQRREPVADLEAGQLLESLRQRGGGYALLGLPLDASNEAAITAAQALSLQVSALLARPLRISAVHEAERLLHALNELKLAFSTPKGRLIFDAGLANWRGIAQTKAAGVPDEVLEQLRRDFLASRPRAETVGWVHAKTSAAWEARGNVTRAMTDLIDALLFDPLNPEYHRRLTLLRAEAEREKLL